MSTKPSQSAKAAPPSKPMSSRLQTMKFMQRAAASAPKTKKAARDSAALAIAATEAEAAQRDAAAQRMRAAKGMDEGDTETRWELSYRKPQVSAKNGTVCVGVGLAQLHNDDSDDEEEEEEEEEQDIGRLVFGDFRKKQAEAAAAAAAVGDDSGSSDGGSHDEMTPKRPKRQEPSLEGLAGISNQGRSPLSAGANMKCNSCNEKGHPTARCPKQRCFSCGEGGHRKVDCPTSAKKKRKIDSSNGGESRRKLAGKSGPLAAGKRIRY